MALLQCPECKGNVSNLALSCPHCGCPLDETQRNQLLYAVVLRAADYNDPKMVERIQSVTGLSEEKAAELRLKVPVTIKRRLAYDACNDLIRTFSANTHLDIIHDEDADTPGNAVPIAQSVPQAEKPSGLSFWAVVGAVVLGIIIMSFL